MRKLNKSETHSIQFAIRVLDYKLMQFVDELITEDELTDAFNEWCGLVQSVLPAVA